MSNKWQQQLQEHIQKHNLKITWQELDKIMGKFDEKRELYQRHYLRIVAYGKGESVPKDEEMENIEMEKDCQPFRCDNKPTHCSIWLEHCEAWDEEEKTLGKVLAEKPTYDKEQLEFGLKSDFAGYEVKWMYPEEIKSPWRLREERH